MPYASLAADLGRWATYSLHRYMPQGKGTMENNTVGEKRRFIWAMVILFSFTAIIALSNYIAALSGGDEESVEMIISGILFGFLAIPIFSVALPLWLSRRWTLPRSWWPHHGHWSVSVGILILYVILGNFLGVQILLKEGFNPIRFIIHFISSMLFHIPYYPLFAILIFVTARAWRGTWFALAITALAFSLYHLAHFHFFPAGIKPIFLIGLFAAFAWDLLLYLFTRSLFLVAFAHCISGAVGMASQGTYHDGVDFVFFLTIVIVSATVLYGIFDHRNMMRKKETFDTFWPRIELQGLSKER